MAKPQKQEWRPTVIERFVGSLPTEGETVVVMTDAGEGYLKATGSKGGEHALACEWVGTQLARWFGLATFDFSLIEVTPTNELPLATSGLAKPGPAFITRTEVGETWSGKKRELRRLINRGDIPRLVVFDTWTLNCDRYSVRDDGKLRVNYNNVFLSGEAPKGKLVLKAMDHTHCFTCGRPLTGRAADIDRVKDSRIYGLFPEFRPYVTEKAVERAVADLHRVHRQAVERTVQSIPRAWDVPPTARKALVDLIVGRASYLAEAIMNLLWPQGNLPFPGEAGDAP